MRFLKRLFGDSTKANDQSAPVTPQLPASKASPKHPNGPGSKRTGAEKSHALNSQVNAECPHCGVNFDPPPARTRKCPKCRERVVVRSHRKQKFYLTEAQVEAFEKKRAREYLRNAAIRAAENIHVNLEKFETRERDLQDEMPGSGPHDVFWSLANERVASLMKPQMSSSDWHRLSMVYFQQALWLNKQERDYWHLKSEADKAYAQSYALQGIETLEIVAEDCDECRAFHGKQYPIHQAVKSWPIPEGVCTAKWCTCTWNLVLPQL